MSDRERVLEQLVRVQDRIIENLEGQIENWREMLRRPEAEIDS